MGGTDLMFKPPSGWMHLCSRGRASIKTSSCQDFARLSPFPAAAATAAAGHAVMAITATANRPSLPPPPPPRRGPLPSSSPPSSSRKQTRGGRPPRPPTPRRPPSPQALPLVDDGVDVDGNAAAAAAAGLAAQGEQRFPDECMDGWSVGCKRMI